MAHAYVAAKGVKMTTLSFNAYGENPFFDALIRQERLERDNPDIRVGKLNSFTMRKYDEVMAWFKKNWPEGVPLPEIVTMGASKSDEKPAPRRAQSRNPKARDFEPGTTSGA